MCSNETGCAGAQPSNVRVAATGAIAATRSLASHASRYAIMPPFERPVTKTRSASVPKSRWTRSMSATRKPTSSTPRRIGGPQHDPAFHERDTPSG